jgi:crotonobetainyl-CoA:carnitine CoA-transferase CaiB-like acyl-CoA transferase
METTMLTSSGYVHSERLTHYKDMPRLPMLDGAQWGLHALNRLYATADGWVMLSVMKEDEWQALAHALGRPEWLGDPRFIDSRQRLANDAALIQALEAIFRGGQSAAWEQRLAVQGVPLASAMGSFEEFMVDNRLATSEEHPSFGTYWRLKPRTRFSSLPNRIGLPCSIGEHTQRLLDEFGYSPAEINRFIDRKIVAAT